MKRDIRKAVEEIKSAGMEDFLHQDPSTFECDDDHHKCTTGCKCTTGRRCT
ncbi:exosporium protein ExsB, partial [Bacillus toyonensis]